MLLIIPIIYGVVAAVGATVGAIAAHAAGEKERSEAKYHRKVSSQLVEERDKLEKKFIDISEKSRREIRALKKQAALSETEKDLLRVCILMHQELISLMVDVDQSPNFSSLVKLQEAIISTNIVLNQLQLSTIPIAPDYFERNYRKALSTTDVTSKNDLFESNKISSISFDIQENCLDIEDDDNDSDSYFNAISNLVIKLESTELDNLKNIVFNDIGCTVIKAMIELQPNKINCILDFLREKKVGINNPFQNISIFKGFSFSNKIRFSFCNFTDFNLSGLYLADLDLSDGIFINADLSGSVLRGSNLSRANLSGVDFSNTNLTNTILDGSNLSGVNLEAQDLSGVHSVQSNFSGVNLSEAKLSEAFFDECYFSGANLSGVDLSHTRMCSSNLYNIIIDEFTVIPDSVQKKCAVYKPIFLSNVVDTTGNPPPFSIYDA